MAIDSSMVWQGTRFSPCGRTDNTAQFSRLAQVRPASDTEDTMRRTFTRTGLTALLMLILGTLTVSLIQETHAQNAVPATPAPTMASRTENGLFTIPEQRDSREQLKAVVEYLGRSTVPWDVVCGTSQRLLDAKSDSFYRIKDAKGNDTGTVISVKAKVNQILAELPKEGRQFYEQEYGSLATTLLKQGVEAGYDKPILGDVAQRYFHTKAGAQATLLLASLDLEAGNYTEAAYGFVRLQSRPDAAEILTPRVLLKAAMSFRRSGDARQAESVASLWERLEKSYPRDGLQIGRRTYTLDELKKELDRSIDLGPGRGAERFTAMRLGNASHTGVGEGGTPFLDAAFVKPMIFRRDGKAKDGAEWVQQNLEVAFKRMDSARRGVILPGFFPVSAPGMVLYRTYDGVYAVASREGMEWQGKTRTIGELLWISRAESGAQSLTGDDERGVAHMWWNQYWGNNMPNVLFENANLGSLSHDGKQVYYVDDLAILPQPVVTNPNMGGFPQPVQPTAGSSPAGMRAKSEYNRLVALNMDTGKVVWALGRQEQTPLTEQEEEKSTNSQLLTENCFFIGPPLPLNGKIYALYERKNQLKLGCFDPNKVVFTPPGPNGGRIERYPELVWTQNLGDSSTSLRTDTMRRIQPAYLAYADGVMICPTNCGVVVAVDINARSLLWARYYGSAPDPKTNPGIGGFGGGGQFGNGGGFGGGGRFQPNGMPMPNATLPNERWRASAPIISGGKVVITAHDSDQIQCLDLRTGSPVWAAPREQDDLYIGSVFDGKVVVVSKKAIRAFALDGDGKGSAKLLWDKIQIGTPSGHGVVAKNGLYYLPVIGNPEQVESKEPQVWAIDLKAGQVHSKTAFRRKFDATTDTRLVLGNLIFQDGQLFSQSAIELTAFPLIELKRLEMVERLKTNPNDPDGLTARGELSLDNGDIRDAIADFKEAQKHNPSDPVRRKIRAKLYIAYTELLRNKFEDGEQYLSEYEALCEVPVDSDDPAEKQRLIDEQIRRRGLYLSLVARGRERQGKLPEAFDSYRAFASLGDNKQLVSIYDEPNGQTRPDVWARGRIDAMIRNAQDPAARKSLDDRVQKEWDSLRTANDLVRLREFVKIFGPFFASGQEAQLLLADQLLQTNSDEDTREAQTLLMQLYATCEDKTIAARATEALARLLTRRGMLEDAVGLYNQLNAKYPEQVVRDGKTGAEVYGELITDKRLLPYLEPTRVSTMSKFKVDVQQSNVGRSNPQGFSLQPDGELFPFFQRFALNMEQNPTDGTWVLRVLDRTTNEERCKFAGIAQFATQNGVQGSSNTRMSLANGQLVLLNLGHFVYCFDLAEKREIWRQNLLGKTPTLNLQQTRVEADGDLVFQYDDGWMFRLGRSMVLQPTYACLVTRDGLKALDPTTGQELWVRTNVSSKVQIFGDAKYIYLIENTGSRVLRAIDGTVVDGVKDFAPLFASSAKQSLIGHRVLVNESPKEDRVLRLYDPLKGVDVWRRELPLKTVVMKSLNPDFVGCVLPNGAIEVIDSLNGKTVLKGELDPQLLSPHIRDGKGTSTLTTPLLLTDSERFYVILNRSTDQRSIPQNVYAWRLRSQPVNGAIYAFDRGTGKRLWYNSDVLLNQNLYLDRFDDLPVLVAAAMNLDPSTRGYQYRVVVVEKQTGRLRHNYPYQFNGEFSSVALDPKTRAIEFIRPNDQLRIRISPDDELGQKR